jgi:hypothetical protein
MRLSEDLRREIAQRFEAAKAGLGGLLSEDGTAVMVRGGLGYSACISPEGDIFMESWGDDEQTVIDRSYKAQLEVLVLGAESIPALSALLPRRPEDTPACGACENGWRSLGPARLICSACSGLGWIRLEPSEG